MSYYIRETGRLDRMIRTAVIETVIPLVDTIRMMSEIPALTIGVYDRKGNRSKHIVTIKLATH